MLLLIWSRNPVAVVYARLLAPLISSEKTERAGTAPGESKTPVRQPGLPQLRPGVRYQAEPKPSRFWVWCDQLVKHGSCTHQTILARLRIEPAPSSQHGRRHSPYRSSAKQRMARLLLCSRRFHDIYVKGSWGVIKKQTMVTPDLHILSYFRPAGTKK